MSTKMLTKRNGKLTVREFIWSKVREHQTFAIQDILLNAPKHHKLDGNKVRYYLNGWESAGNLSSIMTEKQHGVFGHKTYTLIKDTGIEPPRVDPKGKKITTGLGREQMWRTMRMTGQFTYQQLANLSSTDEVLVSEIDAKKFVESLHQAGYLRLVKKGHKEFGLALYQFKPAAWTGNKPPSIRKMNVVFDQNRHEIMYPKAEEIEGDY